MDLLRWVCLARAGGLGAQLHTPCLIYTRPVCLSTAVVGVNSQSVPFPLAGIQLQGEWVLFWLVNYTTLSVGIILAYLIASISPNLDVANAVSSWREGQGADSQGRVDRVELPKPMKLVPLRSAIRCPIRRHLVLRPTGVGRACWQSEA